MNRFFKSGLLRIGTTLAVGGLSTAAVFAQYSSLGRPDSRRLIDAQIRAQRASVKAAETRGDYKSAEDGYAALLSGRFTKNDPTIRLSYAQLLEKEGKYESALSAASPLVHQGCQLDAILLSVRVLKKWKGQRAVNQFLEQIHNVPLNGLSIDDYKKRGLDASQALTFAQGSNEAGSHHWAEAEKIYRTIMPAYPPSFFFYYQMSQVLAAQHRKKEIIPMLEQWYLHSSPEMKAFIKRRCNLNYRRLDAYGKP